MAQDSVKIIGTSPSGERFKVTTDNSTSDTRILVPHVNVDTLPSLTVTSVPNGVLSVLNTTNAILGIGGVWNGVSEDVVEYSSIIVTVHSDKASATDGLELQFSPDNVNWFTADEYTIPAGICKVYTLQTVGPYFRVKYTNGAQAQTTFNICTQYKRAGGVDRSHRVADDLSGQDDADLVKAILAAERPGIAGVYTNIQATNGGNLKVSIEEIDAGALPVPVSDNGASLTVDAVSLPLPTGAATSAKQDTQTAELQAMNLLSMVVFDTILITYTDATKATIQKVEWKLGGAVVRTLTPTFGANTDTWVKT